MFRNKGRTIGPEAVLAAVLMLSSFLFMFVSDEAEVSGLSEEPTRAENYYLSKSNIFFPGAGDNDELYAVAWVENRDKYTGPAATGGDYEFKYRMIANSLAIRLDGNTQNSGSTRRVFVELFTATDCGFCPGADASLDTISDTRFPGEMTLIAWHQALQEGGDGYETSYSRGRNSDYYEGTPPKPTVIFNGEIARVGGDSSANSPALVAAYNKEIDKALTERPMVAISGSGSGAGDNISFNASFRMINPMPRGNWSFKVAICEDKHSVHNSAEVRLIPIYVYSSMITDLMEGYPEIELHDENMFNTVDRDDVHEDLRILWTASDPEDGTNVQIDIATRREHENWETIVSGLSNSGSYKWDTLDPRVPDGNYKLKVLARDSQGNEVYSSKISEFTLDNRDYPEGEITVPGYPGDSLSRRIVFKWNSSDDEDELGQIMERVSISDDIGASWEIITLHPSEWETDNGEFEINSLNYPDLDTYMLKVELRDTDDMVTILLSPRFEIYNNAAPDGTIISPAFKEVVTGTLDIGWQAQDEEDEAWKIFESMIGNFSVKKVGTDEWIELFHGNLDEDMANKTFATSELSGDGDYILRFTITDSRGKSSYVEREFSIYDPDAPEFTTLILAPATADDHRDESFTISWEAEDRDEDETLKYTVEISPVIETNWTRLAKDITETSYDINLSGLEEGRYKARITAVDSSSYRMTAQIEYGPFYWNSPDAPDIQFLSPFEDFNGTIEDDTGIANSTGYMNFVILWSGSDPDNDDLTYSVYYKKEGVDDWTLIEQDLEDRSLIWNITNFKDGSYLLRLVAVDGSPEKLTSEKLVGPFTIDIPWDPPVVVVIDDDNAGDDDEISEGMNVGLIAIAAALTVFIVLIVVALIIFQMSRKKNKKPAERPVIPTENDVDLTAIPDFDRTYAPQATTYSSQTQQGQISGMEPFQQQTIPPAAAPTELPPAQVAPQQIPQDQMSSQQPMVQSQQPAPVEQTQIQEAHEQVPITQAPLGPPPAIPEP
ncbi:MAG: hypothetical protein U9R75_06300 [Candidatus Thermoplasmatota archaeon]|nr:hypothetical protein [Candidatus Thermoplasmatota archaeon]